MAATPVSSQLVADSMQGMATIAFNHSASITAFCRTRNQLHFVDLHAVEQALHEWPKIELQMAAQGGERPLTKQSQQETAPNPARPPAYGVKPHGLSAKAACQVYQHLKQQGDFSIAEGKSASCKDTDGMPCNDSKYLVTKGQILAWRAEALH